MLENITDTAFWKKRSTSRALALKKMTDDRDLWKSLATRAYKETFNVHEDYDDQEVWFDIEDAYEGTDAHANEESPFP